jgi:hypothetical protein
MKCVREEKVSNITTFGSQGDSPQSYFHVASKFICLRQCVEGAKVMMWKVMMWKVMMWKVMWEGEGDIELKIAVVNRRRSCDLNYTTQAKTKGLFGDCLAPSMCNQHSVRKMFHVHPDVQIV